MTETVDCECGKQARYVRRREGVRLTRHGKIRYRWTYYGYECGRGQSPLDKRLGIEPGQLSVELKMLAALLGVQAAYGTATAPSWHG